MSETSPLPPEDMPLKAPEPVADPSKQGIKWVMLLIALSLAWYLLADRFTPYTQQARVGAFVIPVAAEVAGRVIRVNVRNNQDVKAGDVLFEVDQQPYQIAIDRAIWGRPCMCGGRVTAIPTATVFLRADQDLSVEELSAADYVDRGYVAENKRPCELRFASAVSAFSMETIALLIFSGTCIGYLPTHYAASWVPRGKLHSIIAHRLAYRSVFHCITH